MRRIKSILSHLAAIFWTSFWFLAFVLPNGDGKAIFGIIAFLSTAALVILGVKYLIAHWDEDKE